MNKVLFYSIGIVILLALGALGLYVNRDFYFGDRVGATPVLRVFQGGTGSSSLGGLLKGNGTTITSVADASANWNTAYGWGDHAGKYLGVSYSALATSTFQPIGSYLTGAYTAVATSTFQPIGSYMTASYSALATSTFQPIGSYMTAGYSAVASSSFQATGNYMTASYSALATSSFQAAGSYLTASYATTASTSFAHASFTYATSSWSGTTTIPLGTAYAAETWKGFQCFTNAGTLNCTFGDGTNWTNLFSASSTANTNLLSTNNTFTAAEKRYFSCGNPATSPTQLSCTVYKY